MASKNGSSARETFLLGLRNAHAMEKEALSMMRPQLDRIENYPEVAGRLREHVQETEQQIDRLEGLLEQFGEKPSAIKDAVAAAMGGLTAMGHAPAGDEILKNTFASFAFENYEIAAYSSLIVLAQQAGEDGAANPLRQNLEEEENMAAWLEAHLPDVTQKYAALRASDATAKD